jgi:membrane protease YdiL (CAAX protease family)
METSSHPDSHFRPVPGLSAPVEPDPGKGSDQWQLTASRGLLGLLVAIAATLGVVMLIAVAFYAAGVNDLNDNKAFTFISTFAGDLVLVATAWVMAGQNGRRRTLRMFGLRPFRFWSAMGWLVVAFVAYFVLSAIYTSLVNPPPDDLPDQLGVHDSTLLAVITGVFVIAVAPPVEEFFFRGFIFQSLRNSIGTAPGAVASGMIFGAVHTEPSKFVPLAILGTALALLFNKTGSLWPCIMLHALNNTLAFAVTI